jgi:hypothetical protein
MYDILSSLHFMRSALNVLDVVAGTAVNLITDYTNGFLSINYDYTPFLP